VSVRRSRVAVAAALLTLLALLPIAAAPVLAKDHASAEQTRILNYWTKERIANAKPRDFVRLANGKFEMAKSSPSRGKPGGGGTGGNNVLGASWTGGGDVLKQTGKVLFTMDSGDYICTGTVIADATNNSRSIVVSAGHCAYDAADGGFARNWTFYPDFDTNGTYTCAQSKYGCWTATSLSVHYGFANSGGFNTQATTHDWSFASIGNGGFTNQLAETAVGAMPKSFSTPAVNSQTFNFGYPAAGKYHGYDLTYCSDQVFLDPLNSNLTLGVDCDMTGGSSGGPWLGSFNSTTGSGVVDSVNSYGYSGVKKEYGPKFNSQTTATFNAATTATQNTIVGNAP